MARSEGGLTGNSRQKGPQSGGREAWLVKGVETALCCWGKLQQEQKGLQEKKQG